jgi:hypothetical protein
LAGAEGAPGAGLDQGALNEEASAMMVEFPFSRGDHMPGGWPRFDLYVITDAALAPGRSHLEVARAALAGGADACSSRQVRHRAKLMRRRLGKPAAGPEIWSRLPGERPSQSVALLTGGRRAPGQTDLPCHEAPGPPRPSILGSRPRPSRAKGVKDGADYTRRTGVRHPDEPDAGEPRPRSAGGWVRAVRLGRRHRGHPPRTIAVLATGVAGVAAQAAVVRPPAHGAAARALKSRIGAARRAVRDGP